MSLLPSLSNEARIKLSLLRLKTMKNERKRLILFWLSFCNLFGAWKTVGMTMTYNRCGVMNIMWRKTEMEQKSDRERCGDEGGEEGGGAEGERERERERERACWALEYGFMRTGKKEKNVFWIRPWKRKKASNSKHPRGWMGKPESPGKKNISRIQCKPYDINLDEGFTAIKAQKK